MGRRRTPDNLGQAALDAWAKNPDTLPTAQRRTAVRWTLELLAERAPGNSVEVRVPPDGAVQAVAGPRHTRGTPPNTIQTDPQTWLQLATGALGWADAVQGGQVAASGVRAELAQWLPIAKPTPE